jgi:two-component system, NtrC family, nitrogen regulation response regulator GlnG
VEPPVVSSAKRVWVVDDDSSIRWVLDRALRKADIQVRAFESADDALEALRADSPHALITDVRMPGIDGMDLLGLIRRNYPRLPVIIMTAYSDLNSTVAAYREGAFDYLPKPFDIDAAVALAERACAAHQEDAADRLPDRPQPAEIVGEAPAMQEVFRAIGRLSRSNITVLITGDSGTGKELVARALFRHSPRADKSFIALNTAAIPRELLESELFGHEKGAFTGALTQRRGRFEQAHGGTLFLDEIGDMPLQLQTRLLRVLSNGEFYRVGGHSPLQADVRIITATHQDLEERVRQGQFREDLFHRLNVIRIHVPALRDRRHDIPLLLDHFMRQAAAELCVEPKAMHAKVTKYLSTLDWPGNVRQLENTCRWLTVMASGREIHMEDLPRELREATPSMENLAWQDALHAWANHQLTVGGGPLLNDALPIFETAMIEVAMRKTGGRRQEAARLLGWGRNTLTRKIKELRIYPDLEEQ